MSGPVMVLEGEVQFAGWRDSHTGGPLITLRLVDSAALEPFRGMTTAKGGQAGQILTVAIVEGGRETAPTPDAIVVQPSSGGPGSEMASALHRVGWFRNPYLWRALHAARDWTLPAHKRWIEAQPCCKPAKDITCAGDVVLHHCDTAETPAAGRALQPDAPQKPPHWYGIPLCQTHHQWAHTGMGGADRADKRRMNEMAVQFAATAAKTACKALLRVDSLRDADPAAFVAFAGSLDIPVPQAVRMMAQEAV